MAYGNIEIEIKLRLDDRQVENVLSNIKTKATQKGESKQKDTYFVPIDDNYLEEKFPYKWLSIRERGENKILNFKHFYPEGEEKHLYGKEYEVKIDNIDNLVLIFDELKIKNIVTVEKSRIIYQYEDLYEITIDNVVGLGYFMEVEALKELGTPEETKCLLIEFVKSLGIEQLNIDYRGYPFLLLNKG